MGGGSSAPGTVCLKRDTFIEESRGIEGYFYRGLTVPASIVKLVRCMWKSCVELYNASKHDSPKALFGRGCPPFTYRGSGGIEGAC